MFTVVEPQVMQGQSIEALTQTIQQDLTNDLEAAHRYEARAEAATDKNTAAEMRENRDAALLHFNVMVAMSYQIDPVTTDIFLKEKAEDVKIAEKLGYLLVV